MAAFICLNGVEIEDFLEDMADSKVMDYQNLQVCDRRCLNAIYKEMEHAETGKNNKKKLKLYK